MISVDPNDLESVVERVRLWPVHSRIQLVQSILDTVDDDSTKTQNLAHTRMTAAEFAAMVGFSGTTPTDEQCDRIVEQERIQKYGR